MDSPSETATRLNGNHPLGDRSHSRTSSCSARQSETHEEPRSGTPLPSTTTIRRPSSNGTWKPAHMRNGSAGHQGVAYAQAAPVLGQASLNGHMAMDSKDSRSRDFGTQTLWRRSPWNLSVLVLVMTVTGLGLLAAILNSSVSRQVDPKGCRMSWMSPVFYRMKEFDTEHTKFASKYSLYLYREGGVNDMGDASVKGIPVLFIPGNAGSYKQARSIASEAARYYHDVLQHDSFATAAGVKDLDFFTADFNEDFTAFHGQTLLDQAEYLNEAIRYILSLYLDPRSAAFRDPDRPDPASVIIIGHSMGGIVARTMLTMPNYQSNSINTILTMSAPHAYPPISFDAQIVKIYDDINTHWRNAYSQKWANNNPLWHVTLVSIAGGNLDTIVPSDYASLESIVPETHGFTVFTTTIPNVWTSMDHAAITWCDQFRKVIVRAMYEAVDASRASQTRPRAERMRVFKKRFLTGMEPIAETSLSQGKPGTLLTLDEESSHTLEKGERLVLRSLGGTGKVMAYLMPIPTHSPNARQRLSLLSDLKLGSSGGNGQLEVLLCSALSSPASQSSAMLPFNLDLSSDSTGSVKLSCQDTAPDTITLPGSTSTTRFPFYRDDEAPAPTMSYVQYPLEQLSAYDFVAVVDKTVSQSQGWLIAEFNDAKQSRLASQISLRQLVTTGLKVPIPPGQAMVTEVSIPSIRSSLLAYNLRLSEQTCRKQNELFAPLLRQFISEPYESKFFVNVRDVKVSLHGVTPYVPPPMKPKRSQDGLTFQFWIDPTCDSANTTLYLSLDLLGSLGKLYMRYRAVFGAFPLLVVALVLRKQFRVYDQTGIFIPFMESLDSCLRQSLPLLLLSLTLLAASTGQSDPSQSRGLWLFKNVTAPVDFKQNELLLGTSEPFFWVLMPMIGVTCVGVCSMLHYMALFLVAILSLLYGRILSLFPANKFEDKKRGHLPVFVPSSPKRRLVAIGILLVLVSTFIPYQFAYLVACIVQLSTSVRAHRSASQSQSQTSSNFYNYVQSLLLLMILVLQINLPTLVVWVRNLAVNWFEPFSSHHNVLSILPFILLVETLTNGNMIPRVTSRFRHLTSVLLFGISVVAAVYGVSHAYILHYLVNIVAAWLVAIHTTSDSWSLTDLGSVLGDQSLDSWKRRKKP